MGLATHLGPWLLGTVKNTTGTTAGTIRNTGATAASQTNTLSYTDTTAKTLFVLPAGSMIFNFLIDTTVAFNAGTNNVITIQTSGGTSLAAVTATAANITVGRATTTYAITNANIATWTNVGSTDLIVQAVFAGTGAAASTGTAYIHCLYAVRQPDGTYVPTSFTGP